MPQIIMSAAVFCALAVMLYFAYIIPERGSIGRGDKNSGLVFLIIAGLGVRFIGATLYSGHETDMQCFAGWAKRIFQVGAGGFYSENVFTDYPPGYMYVLWIIGAVGNVFSLSAAAFNNLLKMPAILCDMGTALILYKISRRGLCASVSNVICALWLFNPAVILNSAVWGQVDAVYMLPVLGCILLLFDKKIISSCFLFAVAVMIKPQALFYAPLFIYAIIEESVYPNFNARKLLKYLLAALGALALCVLIALPFGLDKVAKQYVSTLSSYPYCSANAYNLWAVCGQNWASLTPFTGILGTLAIFAAVAAATVLFFKIKDRSKYFWLAGFICFSVFITANKMHERYAFGAMLMFLAAFALRPSGTRFATYTAVATTQFLNAAYVLFFYDSTNYFSSSQPVVAVVFGILALGAFGIMLFEMTGLLKADCVYTAKMPPKQKPEPSVITLPRRSVAVHRLTRTDAIIIAAVMAVYSGIALYNLGDTKAPQTGVALGNQPISVQFDMPQDVLGMKLYLGSYHLTKDNALTVTLIDEEGKEAASKTIDDGAVFFWNDVEISAFASGARLSANGEVTVIEAAFIDKDRQPIPTTGGGAAFDEQQLVPERQSFRNSTYFDEIYHARTAYEFIHGLPVYEWTHPPLGKVFISLGIKAFGMTPFGWRIVGTVFGILMIPAMYIFSKRLFAKTSPAAFCTVIFTFDFMHFAQTRIATIDVYITFFIILMYMFMAVWLGKSFYDTDFKRTLIPLGAAGICFGLGTASKWTGLYAGVGLAVMFLIYILTRYREYKYAKNNPNGETNGIKHSHIIEVFPKYTKRTILFCVVFFVIIPAAIYLCSYIPFMRANGTGIAGVLQNQADMLGYHSGVNDEHSFSSRWYQWAIMTRPIWYYSGSISDTVKEGISSFGNPLVWWVGIIAFFYTAYRALRRDKTALFLAVGYLAQLLPWVFVTRITFIYHYFPSVPFVVLMIGYSACQLIGEKHRTAVLAAYAAAVVILFAMFYPVLSGMPVSVDYVRDFLKWFNSWVLISGA